MEIAFMTLLIVVMAFSGFVIALQAKQIERLQDRLLARKYGEYISTQTRTETPEEPKRKPLSWYDDVEIDDDDQQ